jgi:hypothetical protein
MRKHLLFPLALVSLLATGAKGNGCSVEYSPGDGSSAAWDVEPIPTPDPTPRPMSDEWLDGDNCWKQMVAKAEACATATSGTGAFDDDRQICTFDSGGKLELGGPIGTPATGGTLIPVVNWRILGADNRACVTGKILGIGRTALSVQGETVLFENPTLTTYRVTCPDGKTYGNDAAGASPSFGGKWLARKAPGVLLSCDGTTKDCTLELWGGETGQTPLSVCR